MIPFGGTSYSFGNSSGNGNWWGGVGGGNNNGGGSGNPNNSFGLTLEEIQRITALIETFRSNENINIPVFVLIDLIHPDCEDEPLAFDNCAFWSLQNYIASNTYITETDWSASSSNRKYFSDIILFLFENNNSPNAGKTVEVLLDIAAGTETPLNQQQFKELLDAFDLYFDDPENNAEQLVDALIRNNIDPLAVDAAHAQLQGEYNAYDHSAGWDGLTVNKIWDEAGPIKQDFINRYPNRLDIIEDLFAE